MRCATFISGCILALLLGSCYANNPFVTLPQGNLLGSSVDGINIFLGIPYAKAPLGPLRWRPPQHPDSWTGIRTATNWREVCIQGGSNPFPQSEDCLFLNIFAPANATNAPVLLYIHGGGFAMGDSNSFPGQVLAKRTSSIVVTINYRLGIFGFLALEGMQQEPSAFNFGLQDQNFAMQWVQRNIQTFGGDSSQVTIFGESAGGASVQWHLVLNKSWPFFSKAIIESPGPWRFPELKQALQYGANIARNSGCGQSNPSQMLSCMRNVPPSRMAPFTALSLAPTIDGKEILAQPLKYWMDGNFRPNTPIVFGSVTTEGNMLVYSASKSTQISLTTAQQIEDSTLLFSWGPERMQQLYQIYNNPPFGNYFQAASDMIGDAGITCGLGFAAKTAAAQNKGPVYRYLFQHATQNWAFSGLGATHGVELAYVFGVPIFGENFVSAETQLSFWISNAWGNFSKTSQPTPYSAEWPLYSPYGGPSILSIDVSNSKLQSWRDEQCSKIVTMLM